MKREVRGGWCESGSDGLKVTAAECGQPRCWVAGASAGRRPWCISTGEQFWTGWD